MKSRVVKCLNSSDLLNTYFTDVISNADFVHWTETSYIADNLQSFDYFSENKVSGSGEEDRNIQKQTRSKFTFVGFYSVVRTINPEND